jgi:hypothetical protein
VFERFPLMRSTAFERRRLFERGGEGSPAMDLPEFPFGPATIVPRA